MYKKDRDSKIDKNVRVLWLIIIVILVLGGQIAFLIALSHL